MAEPGRSFSLVDRIDALERGPGGLVLRGSFRAPVPLAAPLLAESVGQLAAWGAMAEVGFARRPVAGLCAELELCGAAEPGDEVELEAVLESVDAEAVTYGGRACVGGAPRLCLAGTVGPMVALEDFEDPDRAARRFEALRAAGEAQGGVAPFRRASPTEHGPLDEGGARAQLHVPVDAPYYVDHFPRRPVFPGTLLLAAELELASALVRGRVPEAEGLAPRRVNDVKLRAFLAPGDALELEARLAVATDSGDSIEVALTARRDGRRVAGARVTFEHRREDRA